MTLRRRLTLALLLMIFVAAALARAELGADREASAVFTPAFRAALGPAFGLGLLLAGQFGQAGTAGWLRAAGAALLVLVGAGLATPLIAPLAGGLAADPLSLLTALPRWPLAWGSALAGIAATQAIALRQARDQSRK